MVCDITRQDRPEKLGFSFFLEELAVLTPNAKSNLRGIEIDQ
jgi:hypothetical protein